MNIRRDDGMAMVMAMAATLLTSALGIALVLATASEAVIAANFRDQAAGAYAAEAAAERALDDLAAAENWNAVLDGRVRSTLVDGAPGGMRLLDDGSTIDIRPSLSRLDDPRIRLLQHPDRRGVSSARNTGMDAARGQYVAYLDSDDYWRDRKLERQLAFMAATRPVSCTAFTIKTMRNPDGERRHSAETCTHKSLQVGCGVSPGSTLVGTAAFLRKIGPFNEAMSRLEDWEFLLRCTSEGPIPILGEDLAVIDCRHRDPAQYERTRDSAHTLRQIHAHTLPSGLQRRRFEQERQRQRQQQPTQPFHDHSRFLW